MYRVRIRDLPLAEAYLTSLTGKIRDLRPAWRQISKSLTQFFQDQFDTEGQAGGQPWAPRAAVTQLLLAGRGRAETKILHDSGALERSLTSPTPTNAAIRIFNQKSMTWGNLLQNKRDGFFYTIAAQEGFESTWRPVISRKGKVSFIPRASPVPIKPRVLLPDPIPTRLVADWEQILIKHLNLTPGTI